VGCRKGSPDDPPRPTLLTSRETVQPEIGERACGTRGQQMNKTAVSPATSEGIDEGTRKDSSPQTVRGTVVELQASEEVTFSDLVLAHYFRQTSLYQAAQIGATSEDAELAQAADSAYRNRLKIFQHEHGQIIRAYWCTYEISGVAITEEKIRGPWWRLRRIERRERLYAATDWATRDSPELAHQLHKIDNLSVRADEILRGTAENIAMQLLACAASHVLSYVDRKGGPPRDPVTLRKIVDRSNDELADVRHHYQRAGENATRLVYAGGMLRGAVLLAILGSIGGLVLWAAGTFDRDATTTWTILATLAAGGMGAAVSVLLRMAKGSFSQDYELGRKVNRRLAMARPFVGAAFAVMIFLLLKSGLVDIGGLSTKKQTIYFYAAVGFLAGFSERWARVIIGGVFGEHEPAKGQDKPNADPEDAELDEGTRPKRLAGTP
jgi:hypothetical protein